MNFDTLSEFLTNALHSSSTDDVNFFVASDLASAFGFDLHTHRNRVRADERRFVIDEEDGSTLLLEDTAVFKLALSGTTSLAEAFRVWVAGEVMPMLYIIGGYSAQPADEKAQAQAAMENGSVAALKIAAQSYAALNGSSPEDRDVQDYLAEIVLPALLFDEPYMASSYPERHSLAFASLAAPR